MDYIKIPTWYYQQFDADYSVDVPAEGYGGWKKQALPINPEKTAIVIMHAWDCGTFEQYPGWYRAVEYIPRANDIALRIFPELLNAARHRGMKLFHVADDSGYADDFEGYGITRQIQEKHFGKRSTQKTPDTPYDSVFHELIKFKIQNSMGGLHNTEDIEKGRLNKSFMLQAKPLASEPIAINSEQLHALCLEYGINHLVYIGFAINWCLQYSPGNMNDLADKGIICSTIREAVTAVENKESARNEAHKEYGLWVTALKNGFVYDLNDFMNFLIG